MQMVTIYKIDKIAYLLHGNQKTKSGITIASEPFIKVATDETGLVEIAEAISKYIEGNINRQVEDIKDWGAFNKEFLQKTKLTSSKVLGNLSTKCLEVSKIGTTYLFTPTYHDPNDSLGYIGKGNGFQISLSTSASIAELVENIIEGFNKCN